MRECIFHNNANAWEVRSWQRAAGRDAVCRMMYGLIRENLNAAQLTSWCACPSVELLELKGPGRRAAPGSVYLTFNVSVVKSKAHVRTSLFVNVEIKSRTSLFPLRPLFLAEQQHHTAHPVRCRKWDITWQEVVSFLCFSRPKVVFMLFLLHCLLMCRIVSKSTGE